MSKKLDVPVSAGMKASVPLALILLFLCALLAGRTRVPSAVPNISGYSCLDHLYTLWESFVVLGSPAQWMVALLGFCLYPAFSRTSRVATVSPEGAGGNSAEKVHCSRGPGSHDIQPKSHVDSGKGLRSPTGGFLKRLRRVLVEGRAQARRLCGHDSLRTALADLSRRRSFCSRSSKSEDVLSSRLSIDSAARSSSPQQTASGHSVARRGSVQRKGSAGGGARLSGGSRWQPSMSRITSGQHLPGMGMACSNSSRSSVTAGKRLEILSYNGFQAVDCMSHEMTDVFFNTVRRVVTDANLVQFGAMIGEASAELALSQGGYAAAVGPEPGSLFGPFDRSEIYRQGWEPVIEEHKPGLHYWTWRRPLRKGLFMYKSKTVYENATTAQIMDFTYDIEFRRTWDDSVGCQIAIAPPSVAAVSVSLTEAEAKSSGGRSAFMYARTKFPPPMASRDYTYARRCWAKPDDGGCYCISRACVHPSPPSAGGRAVRVTDFTSGYVIRSTKGVYDTANPAVEVVSVYFEDPCVPSGIVNMSIRRAMWPMVQKAEAAFRDYLLTRVYGNLERPPPERPPVTDSLGAAIGAQGSRAAQAAAADADAASCLGYLSPTRGGMPWHLATSPYVLLYRCYMAMWRGGRGVLLSALSCCMSLWCNATGLGVSTLAAARKGSVSAAAVGKSSLEALRTLLFSGEQAGRVLALLLWPLELVALARISEGSRQLSASIVHTRGDLQQAASECKSGVPRLESHPLAADGRGREAGSGVGIAVHGAQRITLAPHVGRECGAEAVVDGMQSPQGGGRRGRAGLARRCALLAVRLAKVAGASLLLGRAARSESSPVASASHSPAQVRQQQQQSRLRDAQLAYSRQSWK